MSQIIHGAFESATDPAHDDDVPIGDSQAMWGAIAMGLVVGIAGALFAWTVLWPAAGVPLPASAMIPMALLGSCFGIVAGAVVGASEPKPQTQARAAESSAPEGEMVDRSRRAA
jgi:hypothetical protein